MKLLKSIFFENIEPYKYFMTPKDLKDYQPLKYVCALLPICLVWLFFDNLFLLPILMFMGYKLPYAVLKMRYNQKCNNAINAVPLWVNAIYALIEKNTIHNAIIESYENCPEALKYDLHEFIKVIENSPDDRNAYLGFLKRYKIDGFENIMLKLYEFRKLSKDKLKYELKLMNSDLNKLEALQRKNRHTAELDRIDVLSIVLVMIVLVYIFYVAMRPELFSVM